MNHDPIFRKAFVGLILCVGIASACVAVAATPDKSQGVVLAAAVSDLDHAVKQNSNDIAEIRRDEINYRLEKESIKEIYSTVIQAIQIVISIILAGIAIVGYFGLKSIAQLKDAYAIDLRQMQTLKISLEGEIESLRKKQESTDSEIKKIETNQKYKIEMLELVEKASTLIGSGNFVWAMECLKIAQDIDPSHPYVLRLVAACYMGLGNSEAAVETYRKLFDQGVADQADIANFAETLLIAGKYDEYDGFVQKHETALKNVHAGNVSEFLSIMKDVLSENISNAKKKLIIFAEKLPAGNSIMMPGWHFSDFQVRVALIKDEATRMLGSGVIGFFSGAISREFILENMQAE